MEHFFTNDIYIKVGENIFEAKNISSGGHWETLSPDSPFTTDRLLVGTFSSAEPALTKLVKQVLPKAMLTRRARVVIHPTTRIEGGLSEVEERILKELALGAGAVKVVVHVGRELTDSAVVEMIKNT